MNLGLSGKRALVTGASSGLGCATAQLLAAEGAEVIINSRNRERLSAAANRIAAATGQTPRCIEGDLGVGSDITRILDTVKGNDGSPSIDIFVFNNGGPPAGTFDKQPIQNWEAGYRLILSAAVEMTRGLIDGMVRRGWGRLVYITSVAALQPVDDLILSNSFRAGVHGFCKTISNTYAKHGITANCVCPGYTMTERLTELAEKRASATGGTVDEQLLQFAKLVPAGRLGKPDELAALITFLASDRAGFITGTSIPVDGGTNKAVL
jgi:3-oxoacyl-[acyl-carrier protein] reductase